MRVIKRNSKVVQYWQRPFLAINNSFMDCLPTERLIITAILSSFAAISQSAGGYMPGIGFIISAMSTFPIFLATIVSVKLGFLSYFVTILLLLFIQPSELIIFPFTTGILGLALGVTFYKLKAKLLVVFLTGAALFMGIMAILFIFRFPVLGPIVGTSFHFRLLAIVAIFSLIYSWITAEACSVVLKRMAHTLPDRVVSNQRELNHFENGSATKEKVDARK